MHTDVILSLFVRDLLSTKAAAPDAPAPETAAPRASWMILARASRGAMWQAQRLKPTISGQFVLVRTAHFWWWLWDTVRVAYC